MTTTGLRSIGWTLFAMGGLYGIRGAMPSTGAVLLGLLIAWLAGGAWLRRDAPRHGVLLAHDWQWLMAIGWPVSWIWYARRTGRDWQATLGLVFLPGSVLMGTMAGRIARAFL